MIGIVQSDTDEIDRSRDGRAKARAAANERQARQPRAGEFLQIFVAKIFAGEIRHDGADVTDFAILVDESGLFLAGLSVTYEFHVCFPHNTDVHFHKPALPGRRAPRSRFASIGRRRGAAFFHPTRIPAIVAGRRISAA